MPYKNVVFQQNLNIGEKLPFSQTVMMISTVINIAHLEKVFIFKFLTLCYNTLALNYRKVSDSLAVRVFVIQRLRESSDQCNQSLNILSLFLESY